MHWSELVWLATGFLAQICFGARFLSQWLLSERAGRSVLPIHFWYLSVAGAVLLLAYAVHRRDPVIVAGQVASLGIYMRNLRFMLPDADSIVVRRWASIWLGLVGLAAFVGYHVGPDSASRPLLLRDFWTVFGFVGQFLFTGRFLVQWWVTERERRSVMPLGFWYLSIVGTLMLLSYAIAMRDPVIIVGQGLGLFVYVRNLVLMAKSGEIAGNLRTP